LHQNWTLRNKELYLIEMQICKQTLESVILIVVVNCEDFERCHNEKHSSINWSCLSKSDERDENISGVN
jgi:hypothetical protein